MVLVMKYQVLKFDHHVWLERWLNEHKNFTIISINTMGKDFYLTVLINKDNNTHEFKQNLMHVVRTPVSPNENNSIRPFISCMSPMR